MSLTEPTARPAATGGAESPGGEPGRMPAESPRTWSHLRSLSDGQPGDAQDWADDDRLDELFSAWAKAAVATDDAFAGVADAADEPPRPVPSEPAEVRPDAGTLPAEREIAPFVWPASEWDEGDADTASAPATTDTATPAAADPKASWEPVSAWTRTDDDIIPKRRRGRWGRRS
jgi:hypothetical protein